MTELTESVVTDTWYLYVIRCHDNSLYCGISKDVERRFAEHRSMGKKTAKYLRGRGPLTLVLAMTAGNHAEALKLEYYFKSLSKQEKESLIKSQKIPIGIGV